MSDEKKPLAGLPVIRRGADQPTTPLPPSTPHPATGAVPPASGMPGVPAASGAPDDEGDAAAYAALKERRAARRKRKLIRRAVIAAVIVALVGLVSAGAWWLTRPSAAPAPAVTDMVTRGTFTDQVDAKGTLEPLESTVVTPTIDGTIETLSVTQGQQVSAGDVLFTIKNDELDQAVADAERTLKGAKADLVSARRALTQAKQQAAVPQQADDAGAEATGADAAASAPVDTQGAQDAVASAQRAVEAAQAAADTARAKAAERTVKAPASGSVVAMNAQVGAGVGTMSQADAGKPLVQIADLSQMKVTVQVGEEDIAKIARDQASTITFPAFDGLSLTGSVTNIASIASTGEAAGYSYDGSPQVSYAVDVLIPQPDQRLKPGMTAQVSLTTQHMDDVIMVPVTALQTDDGVSHYVNVLTDPETGAFERRDVTVVLKSDDLAVVGKPADAPAPAGDPTPTAPVNDGDELVVSGGSMAGDAGYDIASTGASPAGASAVEMEG